MIPPSCRRAATRSPSMKICTKKASKFVVRSRRVTKCICFRHNFAATLKISAPKCQSQSLIGTLLEPFEQNLKAKTAPSNAYSIMSCYSLGAPDLIVCVGTHNFYIANLALWKVKTPLLGIKTRESHTPLHCCLYMFPDGCEGFFFIPAGLNC